MPELPEVETIRRALRPALEGAVISGASAERPEVVHGDASPAALLAGQRVDTLRRHGKQLAVVAQGGGRCVSIHLGMSGRLMLFEGRSRPTERPAHTHVVWRLEPPDGRHAELWFIDPRRFGGLWTHASEAALVSSRWSTLGPDAATLRAAHLARVAKDRRAPIKAVLLDQRAVAGIGNIYADEALFRARVRPSRPAGSLAVEEVRELAAAVRTILRRAIERGGSTIRDYRTPSGAPGGFLPHHAAYGRGGRPCVRCGQSLHKGLVAGRTTVWCENCQPDAGHAYLHDQ